MEKKLASFMATDKEQREAVPPNFQFVITLKHHLESKIPCKAHEHFETLSKHPVFALPSRIGLGGTDRSAIAPHASLQSVVDFGCGLGLYLRDFKKHGLEVEGVDGNPATPQLSEERCGVADLSQVVLR